MTDAPDPDLRARLDDGNPVPTTITELIERPGLLSGPGDGEYLGDYYDPDNPDSADGIINDNVIRAGWGIAAFHGYLDAKHYGLDEEDEEVATVFSDMVNDLHHTADLLGIEWPDNPYHYTAEIEGRF